MTNSTAKEPQDIVQDAPAAESEAAARTDDGNCKSTDEDDGNNKRASTKLRIVSLLPSITEVLSCLGVGEEIVGITHECDYPEWVVQQSCTKIVTTSEINPRKMTQEEIHQRVTGSLAQGNSLYGLNHDVLRSVRPDIIFTQSLCDVCAVSYPVVLDTCARILAGPCRISNNNSNESSVAVAGGGDNNNKNEPQVISMEPNNLKDVLKTFHVAAQALGPSTMERAKTVVSDLERGFETIRQQVAKKVESRSTSTNKNKPTVAFLEWHAPIFSGGHWIPDMIEIAGGDYSMCQTSDRSAAWTDEDFARLDPDVILIGPCGFSLNRALDDTLALLYNNPERQVWWNKLKAVQTGRVYALDGNSYYARPGPRLLQGCGIMAKCIHDDDDFLTQELAPSSGYCRITPDMYTIKKEAS